MTPVGSELYRIEVDICSFMIADAEKELETMPRYGDIIRASFAAVTNPGRAINGKRSSLKGAGNLISYHFYWLQHCVHVITSRGLEHSIIRRKYVKQRATLSRLGVETASNSFHLSV